MKNELLEYIRVCQETAKSAQLGSTVLLEEMLRDIMPYIENINDFYVEILSLLSQSIRNISFIDPKEITSAMALEKNEKIYFLIRNICNIESNAVSVIKPLLEIGTVSTNLPIFMLCKNKNTSEEVISYLTQNISKYQNSNTSLVEYLKELVSYDNLGENTQVEGLDFSLDFLLQYEFDYDSLLMANEDPVKMLY